MSDRSLLIANLVVTGLILVAVVVSAVIIAPTVRDIAEVTGQVKQSGLIGKASSASNVVSNAGDILGNIFG